MEKEKQEEQERLRKEALEKEKEEKRALLEKQRLEKEAEKERLRKEALERDDKQEKISEQDIISAQDRREKAIESYKVNAGFFEVNRTTLRSQEIKNINKLADEIKKKEFTMITVEGHTDSTGSAQLNIRLSRKRAQFIRNELIKSGLPRDKINIVGFGSAMPVANNRTEAGRAANRRVEIFVE